MIFDCEYIHKFRLEMAERYSKMSEEDADRDFNSVPKMAAALSRKYTAPIR
jgi:hypothetical protein